MTRTVAPGMAPPEESRTTPLRTPAVCAFAVTDMRAATSTAANINTLRNIESPLADAMVGTPKRLRDPAQQHVCDDGDLSAPNDRGLAGGSGTNPGELAHHLVVVGVIH